MKNWDFTTAAAKLELALKSLRLADADAERYWDDAAHQKFQDDYLATVEPKVRVMLDAIHRLAEVFNAAERECGNN